MTTNEYLTLAGIIFGMLGTGISGWVSMRITITTLKVKVENLETNHASFNLTVSKIFDELKEINEKLSAKADRK